MRQEKVKDKRENTRTQSARRANSRQRQRRPGQARHKSGRTRRPGNNATECGPTCGKPHAQPPGGGTSLHPGAASQTGQTAAAKAPHTQAHGRQTAGPGSAGQTQKQQAARKPGTRQQHTGRKNAGAPGTKATQQRQAVQERSPRQAARRIGRRKTPPDRLNSHSLFCLPGGAM